MSMLDAMNRAGVKRPSDYFDERDNLRLEFVSRVNVEQKVRNFARENLKMSQLRKFFSHCRSIERRMRSGQSTWEAERPQVQKLSAFAADARGKGNIPDSFREFIDQNVGRTHSKKDFLEGFMQHFEAIVGFAALHLDKGERNR